jgi:FlaA1/EpsC-like NDP-sugar epimerase
MIGRPILLRMSEHSSVRERVHDAVLRFHPHATVIRVIADVTAWCLAALLSTFLRFGLTLDDEVQRGLLRTVPIVAALQVLSGYACGLYRRRWRYGSYDEVAALVVTAGCTTAGLYLLNEFYFTNRPIPQSVVLVAGLLGLLFMAAIRYCWRLVLEWVRRPSEHTAEKLLVFGAGEGGLQIITALLRNRGSPFVPVGLLDDDPSRQRLTIRGVPVLGDRTKIASAANRTGAETMLIAIPSADRNDIAELNDLAMDAGLTVKVLPPVHEMLGRVDVGDIRDLTEEDLLGRRQIDTDIEAIAHYVTGHRVLVTGAGGSIGSELCRQLHRFGPADLIMLDRDESALHAVQLSISGRALLDTPDTVLADIRDRERVRAVFEERRPHVVFHAAALKHLPLLERHPDEAYKSNVLGTLHVLEAAVEFGTDIFVNISTDKAANPTSVLGYSKRIAERLTSHVGSTCAHGRYLSVRFGNVLGSRGSVLTTFREQIEQGGPVTVTHREVTRFFMTVQEAVQLVIQAGAIGRSGEVLVLDMGDPVRIYDVARRLVNRSGKPVQIVITGLRPGEKMAEELLGDGEIDVRPRHPLISHVGAPPLDPSIVAALPVDAIERLEELVKEQ